MAERKEDLEDELEPGEIRQPKPIIRESKLVLNEKLLERLRKPEKQVEFYQAIQKSMQSAAEYPPKLVQGVSSMINPGNIFFLLPSLLDTIQDYLCKLGMKPHMR